MTILLINFTCHSFSQKSNLGTQGSHSFGHHGTNGSTDVTFCLDSKTINTLTDCPIKSIVGQTTSVGGGCSGRQQQQKQKFTQTRDFVDMPVKNLRQSELN